MRVELLYADGDPHAMAARQQLVEVLTEDAFETTIQMVAVGSAADAEFLALPGSPTIRIDGSDIHPEGVGPVGLYPRNYPAEDGGDPAPIPGKGLIRRAVDRARGWSHEPRRP